MTTTPRAVFAAIDLGASSGRVMLGRVLTREADAAGDHIELSEVARFANGAVEVDGQLHWDILALYRGILSGLRAAVRLCAERGEVLAGIGIDSWAVDYGLLDRDGKLLGNPVSYRDARTQGLPERVYARVSAAEHYKVNGLQTQPFNTEFQLLAAGDTAQFAAAHSLLLIPDLLNYWLTGHKRCEITNASTTGLIDVRTRDWSQPLLDRLSREFSAFTRVSDLLSPVIEAGEILGSLRPLIARDIGLDHDVPVVAVGSHDTASAVVAVPARSPRYAYISCGTWALVGVELDAPVLTAASRTANFTHELGVDGTVRYLRNVMGLWVLQESLRTWEEQGHAPDLAALLAEAGDLPGFTTIVDIDSSEFLAPGDMPARIARLARETGQPVPATRGEVVRCIIDSLAVAFDRALRQASELSGQEVEVIHMVGGGIQNELLCQLTADLSGLPVVAGPVEGAVLGNILIQARAVGHPSAAGKDLTGLRELGARGVPLKHYAPRADAARPTL